MFQARLQAGLQYSFFDRVTDMEDGWGILAGLQLMYRVTPNFSITYNPQVVFGDSGDRMGLHNALILHKNQRVSDQNQYGWSALVLYCQCAKQR